jgi:hypothetical protein
MPTTNINGGIYQNYTGLQKNLKIKMGDIPLTSVGRDVMLCNLV